MYDRSALGRRQPHGGWVRRSLREPDGCSACRGGPTAGASRSGSKAMRWRAFVDGCAAMGREKGREMRGLEIMWCCVAQKKRQWSLTRPVAGTQSQSMEASFRRASRASNTPTLAAARLPLAIGGGLSGGCGQLQGGLLVGCGTAESPVAGVSAHGQPRPRFRVHRLNIGSARQRLPSGAHCRRWRSVGNHHDSGTLTPNFSRGATA